MTRKKILAVGRCKAQITGLKKDISWLLSLKGSASIDRIKLACAIKDKRSEIFEIKDHVLRYYKVSL